MMALPPELSNPLRQVLLACDEFSNPRQLSALFDDGRLIPFKNSLPEASSRTERVDLTISYLLNKKRVSGENALALLLEILAERQDEQNGLFVRLKQLNTQLSWLEQINPTAAGYRPEANPEREPMLQTLEVEQIYRAAHAVAHVGVPRYLQGVIQSTSYFGTAWMLTPTLAITCAHVLRARTRYETLEETDFEQQVANTLLTFDFLSSGRGSQVKISQLEHFAEEQDYAILRLAPSPGTTYLTLAPASTAITTQTALFILQHPLGQPQQGAFGRFVQPDSQPGLIHYRTPTEPGTSGAPVLNRQNWQVLALHQGESLSLELRQGRLMTHILEDLAVQAETIYLEIVDYQSGRT